MSRRPSKEVRRSKAMDYFISSLDERDKRVKWIRGMESVLRENIFAGERIPKIQIPSFYVNKYGVNNLYRYEHPEGHRSCYTLIHFETVGLCPVILDFMTHSEYDKKFGYRTT